MRIIIPLYHCTNTIIQFAIFSIAIINNERACYMNWEFNDDMPIYLQIIDIIKAKIASGELKPKEKLKSVRELALEAGVNPNTMQKAMTELERQGIVYSQRTSGRFISEGGEVMSNLKKELQQQYIEQFVENMKKLGIEPNETLNYLNDYLKNNK